MSAVTDTLPKLKRAPKPDDPRERFLVELSRALGTYGTAADRIEEVVGVCGRFLGMNTHCFSTPTSVFLSIETEGGRGYQTYLSRVVPGEVNLSKLRDMDRVFNLVADGKMRPDKGTKRIKEIVRAPDHVPAWLHVVSFLLVSMSAAVILGGGLKEMLVAGVNGGACGALVLITAKKREHARLIDFLCGFVCSVIAWSAMLLIGPYAPSVSLLAGLIALIPGLTLTISMTELATRNMVSGSARLIGALMILLLMAFGAVVGSKGIGAVVDLPLAVNPDEFPVWAKSISAVIAGLLFVVLFRAKWSDWWAMVLAVLVAFYSSRFGTESFGLEFGVCFAACCVGVFGNMYARATDRPSVTVILPGLLMLVPGSIGFKSVQSLMDAETITGIEGAFSVFVVGSALVVGLLLSNVLVSPRKVL